MREHWITGRYIVILTSFMVLCWSGVEESLELTHIKFILDYDTKIKELRSLWKRSFKVCFKGYSFFLDSHELQFREKIKEIFV